MKNIIREAVAAAFDTDALAEAIGDAVADLIDYEDIASDLLSSSALADLVHDEALEIAESLL